MVDDGAGRAVQDDGRTFEQAVWRAIQSYPGTIEIDNAQRFREHLWGRLNASESPPTATCCGHFPHGNGPCHGMVTDWGGERIPCDCDGRDASESPPTEVLSAMCQRCGLGRYESIGKPCGDSERHIFDTRDASESGQPPEASDE